MFMSLRVQQHIHISLTEYMDGNTVERLNHEEKKRHVIILFRFQTTNCLTQTQYYNMGVQPTVELKLFK